METAVGLIAIFSLVLMNGFFVAAEFGLVGARKTRIAQLTEQGNPNAKAAQTAIRRLDSSIAATQLGITLASLALGWIGEPAISHVFEPVLERVLPPELMEAVGFAIASVISFALVTVLHIVLGELAPKAIALQRPESAAMFTARPLNLFLAVFHPIIRMMNWMGNSIIALIGFKAAGEHSRVHSADEIVMLVHSSAQAGILEEKEEEMLRRVFNFDAIQVQEIMQPRVEIEALDADMTLTEMVSYAAAHHRSRYPVYEQNIDHIVAVLHTKDLFQLALHSPANDGMTEVERTRRLLRKPLFVPETLGIDHALEKMQRTKTHIAIVVNEYGGVAGVVTLEDVIEQIIGDVQDEFDREENPMSAAGSEWDIDGMMTLNQLHERFGAPGDGVNSLTIGGYVAEVLDRIADVGDSVPFGDYRVTVTQMDGKRVSRVRFKRDPSLDLISDTAKPPAE
jgi:CBS domain containing-hemolysin-like protein